MKPQFWHERNVLVTGHTGFKGSWLSMLLHQLGAKVTGYALDPPTSPSLFEQAAVADRIQSIRGDIRNTKKLVSVVRDTAPDVIFHLAAQSVVRESYNDPVETYSSNVTGTASLLHAARSLNQCSVINVTSDKCYENQEWLWAYRETDRLGGHDPYSSSKACAEIVTQSFRDSFFPLNRFDEHKIALATARAGNVIGGGDWTTDQLIPDIVRAILEDRPVLIRQPDAVRPWQHVLDCLAGYLTLAENLFSSPLQFSEAWNFGPRASDVKPVSWIADYFAAGWEGMRWEVDGGCHPHEARLLYLDSTRARSLLQWSPVFPLTEALDWTLGWYKDFSLGTSSQLLCETQIENFVTRQYVN